MVFLYSLVFQIGDVICENALLGDKYRIITRCALRAVSGRGLLHVLLLSIYRKHF